MEPPPKPKPLVEMTPIQRQLVSAHGRREHDDDNYDWRCPVCRNPDYWTQVARYLGWLVYRS